MVVGRPKKHDFPDYMTPDGDRGGFLVRNPISGKRKRFGPDQETEARATAARLAAWVETERQAQLLDAGRPTIRAVIIGWRRDRLHFQPWDAGTANNYRVKFDRIDRELGPRIIARTDATFLEHWLGFCRTGDNFNKYRNALALLWRYAVSRKFCDANEAEKLEYRSMSKKLAMNQKRRQPLDVTGYKAIHAAAPAWLQVAMDLSLVTLQARMEVCKMRREDRRDGFLYVIRDKTSGDSDMAFIRIRLTDQIEEILARALALDSVISPFVIHRKPLRRYRERTAAVAHWTMVRPHYLSQQFAKARELAGVYANLKAQERPTFHEIRGLGSRLYAAAGVPDTQIQALMTHAHKRTTEIYLDGGKSSLKDSDFLPVVASLTLRDALK